MNNHEIDYKIHGEELQCVEIELDPQEAVISEPGSFMMMTDGIQMETLFGDGTETGGLLGKLFSAGKRLLTGENLFMTVYTNTSYQKRQVTFAAPYSGKIIPLDLSDLGGKVICQKDSFLCAAKGVSVGIEFQRKLGTGLFGGEGFIMQKLEGDGMAFVHSGGYGFGDTEKSVRETVKAILDHPLIPEDVHVSGFIIDSITGALTPVVA
jgi:uncharacterized protein (AIM24 family)